MNSSMSIKYSLLLIAALMPIALFGGVTLSVVLCGALLAYMRFTGKTYFFITDCVGIFVFLLAFFSFDFASAAVITAEIILLAFIVCAAFRGTASFSTVITGGGAVALAANAFTFGVAARAAGVKPVDMMFKIPLEQTIKIMESAEGIDKSIIKSMADQSEKLIKTFEMMAPAFLIISALLTAYITFALARTFAEKHGERFLHLPYFYELRMPAGLTAVFLALFAFTLIIGSASAVTVNAITIIMSVLAVCGVSLVDYHLKKLTGMHGAFRFLIYMGFLIFISLTQLGIYPISVLFAAGALDSFVPLRR